MPNLSPKHNDLDSDEEYWQHVPEFDAESLLMAFSSLETSDSTSDFASNRNLPDSVSAPASPSSLFDIGTPRSFPAHSIETSPLKKTGRKKRTFYAVTRGRAIGVFDNWLVP